MDQKIVAVVVTYNRSHLLPRCLNALFSQTETLQVVVVDNASTDSTNQILSDDFGGVVHVVRMKNNTGGAGGFYTGIEVALGLGATWVWLMDDDGFPDPTCLSDLLKQQDVLDVMNPLVCAIDHPGKLAFGLRVDGDLTDDVSAIHDRLGSEEVLFKEINPFNGTLIRADVIRKHGNIKPEMFIWGDEVEFVLRMLKSGLRVGTVVVARFNHPINKRQTVSFGKYGSVTVCPTNMSHFFYRNNGFSTIRYRGVVAAFGKVVLYTAFFLVRLQFAELLKFWLYYLDGLFDGFFLNPSRADLISRLSVLEPPASTIRTSGTERIDKAR